MSLQRSWIQSWVWTLPSLSSSAATMDFLTLLSLYLLLCVCVLVCWLKADHPYLSQGPLADLRHTLIKCCVWCLHLVPPSLLQPVSALYEWIFCKRNCVFQVLYVVMVVVGHAVWVLHGVQYLYALEPDTNHVFWPLVLLLCNSGLFLVCCVSDPGHLHKDNVDTYLTAFPYDGVMYAEHRECPTCHLLKPARSKHCAMSDQCIFKFDHFCAWTNNCFGGLNQRYFLAFLISACVMCANGAAVMLRVLLNITLLYNLWSMKYIDDSGKPQPVTFQVLAQSLFMQFPHLVFLAAALTVITVALTAFTSYHLYLAATNQTTNERYKKYYIRRAGGAVPSANFYDRGLWRNTQELLSPLKFVQHRTPNLVQRTQSSSNERCTESEVNGICKPHNTKRKRQ